MRSLLITCLVALAACGDDARSTPVVAVADTVDGVERWRYSADAATELDWPVDTLGVVGDALAEDAYQFDDVSWERLASDAAGNLYILDRQGARVLKYGPDLSHLATFGRSGEGPGELSRPNGLTIGPGDTVWVTDFANSRLTGYPQGGGDPRTIPYRDDSGIPAPVFAALADGFIQSFRPMPVFPGARQGGPGGGQDGATAQPLLRLTRSLEPVDTFWTIPEPPVDMIQLELGQRMMVMMMPREFSPEFQWQALSDGGVVVSDTAAYLLRLIGPDGALRRVIERDPAPRAATEADRELVRQRLRDEEAEGGTSIRMGGGGAGPDEATRRRMLEQRLEKMTFASVLPRVVSLRVDPLDRIWVGVAGEVPDSVGRIDVYEPDGTLVGELRGVPMPDVFVGEDRIGVLRRDELDVQQVVLMELNRPLPPS
ncbi:MAG TPA: hypothetical protein VMM83_05720 [Longimicrobiales bacterium]|nr:hypothetical protein [Longimicrobiales bacterium]